MKKFLLILLAAILILLPSCKATPDEPLSPLGPTPFSDSRMTETQRQEIIDIIEKSSLKYDGSTLGGNVDIESFYRNPSNNLESNCHTSFMQNGYGFIESSSTAFEIFDETFFFPEANGEYIYLFFLYEHGEGNSLIEECISANLEDGILTLSIKRKPENFSPIDGYSHMLTIFKIKKSSLDGNIKQVKYAIDYSELK